MEQKMQTLKKTSLTKALWQQKEKITISILFTLLAIWLLGEDSRPFLTWWAAIWILGCSFMPLTGMLFSGFRDKGWMFSKAIAIAIAGYSTWLLVSLGLIRFTPLSCFVVTSLCIGANFALAFWQRRAGLRVFPAKEGSLVFWEEAILFLAFLLWTYAAGFRPQAFGEEKFMDFGFMAAMMRSTTLPATDIWYSSSPINYYYGGQYYAVFLTKLTGTQISATYHLMRTFVAGMAFALPFSLVRQAAQDYFRKTRFCSVRRPAHGTISQAPAAGKPIPPWKKQGSLALCSGLLAGIAVSLAGNMHYVIYGIILPLVTGQSYWFPDSTRYIGHNPPTADETIHEFPSYSFLQGDLHAHVVNVFFVLTVLGLLYAWAKQENHRWKGYAQHPPSQMLRPEAAQKAPRTRHGKKAQKNRPFPKGRLLPQMPLIACSVFLGIFQWSNAWDFAIYYVVLCGTCFFCNLANLQNWKKGFSASIKQWLWSLAISFLVALPFTLQFDSGMAQGIRLAQNHSAFYQLCILWGLPVSLVIVYLLKLFGESQKKLLGKRGAWLAHTKFPDLYIAVLSLCAIGLVLMPELVYLRDIYEETSARSNTMFKLSYQAFILFGISMGFLLVRFLADKSCKWIRFAGLLGLLCLLLTSGYTATASKQWFGELWDRSGYQGLDATAFLEKEYPADAPAIRWLQANAAGASPTPDAETPAGHSAPEKAETSSAQTPDAETPASHPAPEKAEASSAQTPDAETPASYWPPGQEDKVPVLLEAPGDSYSRYCRVSAMTGLPTVEGWYVHEWLWRGDTDDLNQKKAEIETIYTSTDEEEVWGLLSKYHVEYIFVGQMEWESYPALNLGMLKSFGDVVFDNGTVIIQVTGH